MSAPIPVEPAAVPVYLPFFTSRVPAGFPSPAEDHIEGLYSLDEHIIRHPAATFLFSVSGTSMLGAGISPGDIAVVDRSLLPAQRDIVLATVDGEFTIKRYVQTARGILLQPANAAFQPLLVTAEMDGAIWGVVTYVIHQTKRV